ncbi:MAG: alpha/beta hydrolase [Beijerinckiaceae bacterium]|nr:alpha/beta hydrolase [Beijerinckiaceae bacterium]
MTTHGIDDQIWRTIREMGAAAEPAINKASKAMFAPLLESSEGVRQTLDMAYGAHERQTLDVYCADGVSGAQIVLYVPGGGFTGGDKRQDDFFFGNVGRFLARRGVIGVTMNYRLAPDFTWPAAAQDVKAAVAWIKANAHAFGGDPSRLVVFGHSAGAAHAGTYVFDPDLRGDLDVRAAVLSSGLYVLRAADMRPNVAQYFGGDEGKFQRRSALTHVGGTTVPVFLSVAEFDPVPLATPTFELAAALTRRDGHPPQIMRVDGHNHFSYISSIGSPDVRFSDALLSFVLKSCA